MSVDPQVPSRAPRLAGLALGGLFAFLFGGPLGFLAFMSIALIAAVFTIQK
jgi:hypothetical protein